MWDTLSPIALFVSAPDFVTDRNDLVAVAIQMDHTKGTTLFSCSFPCLSSVYMDQTHIFVTKEIRSNNVADNPYISRSIKNTKSFRFKCVGSISW